MRAGVSGAVHRGTRTTRLPGDTVWTVDPFRAQDDYVDVRCTWLDSSAIGAAGVDADAPLIDAGRVTPHCVDAFGGASWPNPEVGLEVGAHRPGWYEPWILDDVIPPLWTPGRARPTSLTRASRWAPSTAEHLDADRYAEFSSTRVDNVDVVFHEWVRSADLDDLLVGIVKATYPPDEHEDDGAHFRGLIGARLADRA
jgi:hypothetical protein